MDEGDAFRAALDRCPFDLLAPDPGPELFTTLLDRAWAGPPSGIDTGLGSDAPSLEDRLDRTLATALNLLRARDLGPVADVAQEQARRPQTVPRIVVVGETKRGKSTLINALAGWTDLSPVGVAETSATYLSVVPSADRTRAPWAEVILADGVRREIDLSLVPNYADLTRLDETENRLVVGVDVHVPPGPLGDVVLTDTPGIGGIGGVRGRMDQQLASDAGCLMFVLDAGAPLTRIELDYLDECALSVENVVVAVTMIDKYPQRWPDVVSGVRDRLRRHSTRLGSFPVVGVSAQAALSAQTMPPGSPMRDRLMEASGLTILNDELRTRLPSRFGPVRNALRICSSALSGQLDLISLQQHINASDPQVDAELLAHEDELRQLQAQQERWALELERDLGRLRAELARLISDRFDRLSEGWHRRIERTPILGRKEYVRAASLDMATDYRLLREELTTQASEELHRIVGRMFGDLMPQHLQLTLTAPPPVLRAGREHVAAKTRLTDPGVLMSASVGAGMAAKIAGFSLLGPVAGPVAVVGAGAWIAFNLAYRTNRIEQQNLTRELTRSLSAERTMIMSLIDDRIRELKPDLIISYRQMLNASKLRLQRLITDAEDTRARSDASRRQTAAGLTEAAEQIRRQLQDLEEVLAALR